ncbi:MAG: Tol-Pal system protein TolB [Simkaniaceae bacterium]|nr:Tol-Pal system protein TolB [Candidatus Sacchlamyda saccharinae]
MSLRFVIISLLALVVSLHAEEEIRVELTTKAHLSPFYISRIHNENAELEPSYLKKLHQVLEFDLRYSGFATVVEMDEILEKALKHTDPNVAFNPQRWEKGGVSFVVKGSVTEKKLDLFALNVKTGSLKKFEDVPLSGNLSQDRRQMHKLSDALLSTLFGAEGVADSRILYSLQVANPDPSRDEWKAEIWECDFDGANAKQITYEHDYSITPVLIPSHPTYGRDRFLYVNYKNGQPKIYFSSLKNRTGKPLIHLRGNQLLPAVSNDRDKLAFISDAGGRADLFLQTIDDKGMLEGKPTQLFSYPRATQASPSFSPSGEKIAFVSDKDGTPRIYIIPSMMENNKRADPTLITKRNRENTCPTWSPDGTKIAYSAKTNGVRQIWIYDLELEEEQQLTTGPGNKENPCWAKDSLHLVFNSTDTSASELYLVNLNQPEAVKITSGSGKKHYPTWGTKE